METRDRLRKLSRYELVELIYDLRRDNIALEKRCREAELRLAQIDQLGGEDSLAGRLERMEALLSAIRARVEGGSGPTGEA